MKNHVRLAALMAAGLLGLAAPAAAQNYPSRQVNIIVPYPAGGPTDQLARELAPRLSAKLGQNFIVENVSGGGTTIATGRVARAAPDGHTLLLHNLQISANVTLFPKVNYNTEQDLTPIAFVNRNPLVLVGRKTLTATNFAELVAWMKSTPAKIAYPGPGSTGHLATALLARALGVQVDMIPYRGAAPAMTDILGGHVDLFYATPQSVVQPVREKLITLFGVTSAEDVSLFPGAPNLVREYGPQVGVEYWHALFAPAKTPPEIVDALNKVVQEMVSDPAVVKAWAAQGVSPYPADQRSPEAARALMSREVARWGKVIHENKIEAPM
ncbi:MAG: tripartite tricarboxylate transporter substrate binding protein [Variibacter sp.]|nr:tripartite tricarboxylate transporter substrate binding protein [Variibacter sp.]